MTKLFLIAGLGADSRVYKNIEIPPGYNVIPVDRIVHEETDTISAYAQKLINHYEITDGSVVVGNSLGGIIAIEIAKQVALSKVILISSIKTSNEAPGYFSFFRHFPLYKIIPARLMNSVGFLTQPVFGKMSNENAWLFNDMLKKTSPVFMKWAMKAVLNWNNKVIPEDVIHIAGDKDFVFPFKKIKDPILIKGGTHIMIISNAGQINKILKDIL
jgi:pimeloyl-ACP methyl ester carboxylesterase